MKSRYDVLRLEIALRQAAGVNETPILLERFEGLIAALALCPSPVPESEWLPGLGVEAASGCSASDSHEVDFISILLAQRDRVCTVVMSGSRYTPASRTGVPDAQYAWTEWIRGFVEGMWFRPRAWRSAFLSDNEDIASAAEFVLLMNELIDGPRLVFEEVTGDVMKAPKDTIAGIVNTLAIWRRRVGSTTTGVNKDPMALRLVN
jgi:yecA family protein